MPEEAGPEGAIRDIYKGYFGIPASKIGFDVIVKRLESIQTRGRMSVADQQDFNAALAKLAEPSSA